MQDPQVDAEPMKMLESRAWKNVQNYTCPFAELGCNWEVAMLTKQFSCKDWWKKLYLGSPRESKEALPLAAAAQSSIVSMPPFPHSL